MYVFHRNDRTREELRDNFIQASHFFRRPNPVIRGNNLYEITLRSRGGIHGSLTQFSGLFLLTTLPWVGLHIILFTFFFQFECHICTYKSRVLIYFPSHLQYSPPQKWHLHSVFKRNPVYSCRPQGRREMSEVPYSQQHWGLLLPQRPLLAWPQSYHFLKAEEEICRCRALRGKTQSSEFFKHAWNYVPWPLSQKCQARLLFNFWGKEKESLIKEQGKLSPVKPRGERPQC